MSRFLLYSDWLIALGGGERYLYAIAKAVAETEEVVVAGPTLPDAGRLKHLGFSTALPHLRIDRGALPRVTASYDVLVHSTTRLPTMSAAGRSVAIVQFPADHAGRVRSWRHPRARLRARPQEVIPRYEYLVYSRFAQEWLRRRWRVESTVLTPPMLLPGRPTLVEVHDGERTHILSVGRFFGSGAMKRQDVVIAAYKRLSAAVRARWPLVLAGPTRADAATEKFVRELRRSAEGFDISFAIDCSPEELERLYRRAAVYWHAAGYGRRGWQPERAEHFGMATVEAMSRGAVPLVFGDGGQCEIVSPDVGMTWRTIDGLVEMTEVLLSDRDRLRRYGDRAYRASLAYDLEAFERRAREVLVEARSLNLER